MFIHMKYNYEILKHGIFFLDNSQIVFLKKELRHQKLNVVKVTTATVK